MSACVLGAITGCSYLSNNSIEQIQITKITLFNWLDAEQSVDVLITVGDGIRYWQTHVLDGDPKEITDLVIKDSFTEPAEYTVLARADTGHRARLTADQMVGFSEPVESPPAVDVGIEVRADGAVSAGVESVNE